MTTLTTLTTNDHKQDILDLSLALCRGGFDLLKTLSVVTVFAANGKYNLSKEEVGQIVKEAFDPKNKFSGKIAAIVKDWVENVDGIFTTTEMNNDLGINSREEKKAATMALLRLVKEKILEKVGEKRGCYRRLEKDLSPDNWIDANENPVCFNWPLETLGQMVCIAEKNIVVVAGESNVGKTGFMLDFVRRNLADHEIHYFSSEMGPGEFKDRVLKFNEPLAFWSKLKFYEKSSGFDRYIQPDAINIIDYLELHDNFYQAGGFIRAIFDKLNKGVALVALQKKAGTDYGRGGEFTQEKSRLYLSLSKEFPGGRCKIVKAKKWNTETNPNGYSCKYKLLSGCRLIEDGLWERK
jgi:hypothetical protein